MKIIMNALPAGLCPSTHTVLRCTTALDLAIAMQMDPPRDHYR